MAFRHVGTVALRDGAFVTDLHDERTAHTEGCLYAFVIGDEIVRIGSTKGPLRKRIRSYDGYITRALNGQPSQTPQWEAAAWRERLLAAGGWGEIWARQGWQVETPVGNVNAYIAEEYVLLERFAPPLNRSSR